MKLVIDTNRIMAGLLKDSTSRKIILHDSFSFFAPDYIGTELSKHRPYLMKKAKIQGPDFDLLLHTLLDHIILVPFEDFEHDMIVRCGSWRRLMKMTLLFLQSALLLVSGVSGQRTGISSGRIFSGSVQPGISLR